MRRAKQAVPSSEEMPAEGGGRPADEAHSPCAPALNSTARTEQRVEPIGQLSAPSPNGGDHARRESHRATVAATNGHGQSGNENRYEIAVASDAEAPVRGLEPVLPVAPRKTGKGRRGRSTCEAQMPPASPPFGIFSEIAHAGRMYWASQNRRKMLGNSIDALERQKLAPAWKVSMEALAAEMEADEENWKKHLVRLVRMLPAPIVEWVEATPGIGLAGLGMLLSCTGSLSNFPNVAKLWAYLGMHVVGGRAPKRTKGRRANWSQKGREVCFNLGEAIVKVGRGLHNGIYRARRDTVLARPGSGPSACPLGKVHVADEKEHDKETGWNRKTGETKIAQCVKVGTDGVAHSAHVHADARRVAMKAMLADLWGVWQKAYGA